MHQLSASSQEHLLPAERIYASGTFELIPVERADQAGQANVHYHYLEEKLLDPKRKLMDEAAVPHGEEVL